MSNYNTRKQAEMILAGLGVAEVLATFYTIYPPVAIALIPLAIYCLLIVYWDDTKRKDNGKPHA
ncbi:hypothetical protein [Microseira wollei]|uniref:Uncharacterized protein n=1 Tax=Microseira wollei NIES-4236 TaxID=2530354 RepID=A0AAV3XNS1_9CYAN|nr:hypothetical protein [Microseira wollei]GET44582.1 hypothetical protein MiSe_94120 [Microseira wollei NIES-4236]